MQVSTADFRFETPTMCGAMARAFRGSVLLCSVAMLAIPTRSRAEEPVDFDRQIRLLLSDKCFVCHGPDSASRQASLRLDQRDSATAELESGVIAIVPSDVGRSALVERIMSEDPDVMMPPPDSHKSLSVAEKALLRRWIEQGAKYEPHWAFVAPARPARPEVAHPQYVQNPIDAFVVSRLEKEGIDPAPRASKERLIRRLYFDLIGIPPTLQEIDSFLADESADAYDRLIDRLFESPHYGERMAIGWLDGARYADSNGYQNDFARDMWPWRDWVIAAFNAHMPYDQFVTEQLAGDLLPSATLQQRIATGFNRNHRTVTEAGSIEAEWFVENVVDRVETTSTVMLGLTVGCARCHDHKFDPITQREFYQLYAFFNNIDEKGMHREVRGNVPPLVKVTTPEQEQKLAEFDARIAELKQQISDQLAGLGPHRRAWLESLVTSADRAEPEAVAIVDLRKGTTTHVAITGSDTPPDAKSVEPTWRDDLFGKVAVFAGKQHLAYHGLNFLPSDRPFSWSVWVKPAGDGAILSKMDSAAASRGVDLYLFRDGKIGMHLVDAWPGNALKVRTKQPLARDKWSHIVATYDGSGKAGGVGLYINGRKQDVSVEVDRLSGSFDTDQPFRVGMRSAGSSLNAALVDVRLFQHALTAGDVEKVFRGSLRRGLEEANLDQFDEGLRSQFDELLFAYSSNPVFVKAAETKRALENAQAERTAYESAIPTTMILEERQQRRKTYLLQRGRYDQPDETEELVADVPAALPSFPTDAPRNRLGLAQWLTSPENPLVARVVVNRLWQRFFGQGLVKSPDNFGVRSEPPSHPELLDWLATELIRSNWSLEHIQRLIVSSHTYQQQSEASPELYERDPENRLLARGPRHRLQAEAVRDNALAVSGLLVKKIGGPSVMPYQPEGLWEELAGRAIEIYVQGHGDDLYRRSLYVYRRRTVPHPTMATFDAPSWEVCQMKRDTTNTPLQALALFNDVTYVEAARKFAERMLTEGGRSPESQLTFAFRLATGRAPTSEELESLRASLKRYLAHFRQSPTAAEQFVSHGESPRDETVDVVELAAHTAVASVLLNMDETLSKN